MNGPFWDSVTGRGESVHSATVPCVLFGEYGLQSSSWKYP
jgi:hypothetical protein